MKKLVYVLLIMLTISACQSESGEMKVKKYYDLKGLVERQIIALKLEKPKVKKDISVNEQCNATRMDGERCTRRKKQDGHFCGTHINCPSPIAFTVDTVPSITDKVVSAIDIQGIIYYIDEDLNVYNTEDVIKEVVDPSIIGRACINNGVYTIPSLGLV